MHAVHMLLLIKTRAHHTYIEADSNIVPTVAHHNMSTFYRANPARPLTRMPCSWDNDHDLTASSHPRTENPSLEEHKHDLKCGTTTAMAPTAPRTGSKGDSNFFANSDGREMLDLMDSLRSLDKINATIPLPQIIVFGQQSCGKSSVLNAISGIKFPVDQGMTTRFPIEIILRRTAFSKTSVSFRQNANRDRPKELDDFEQRWSTENISLNRLADVITDAIDALGLRDAPGLRDKTRLKEKSRFADTTLILEICSPEQENLTLIDLPGFINAAPPGQCNGDLSLVEKIIEEYMMNERAIILAVFSGGIDFENQKLIQKLKDNTQYGRRSLGVLTAPDSVEPGSLMERKCLEHVRNQILELKYGWHVIRNLNLQEVKRGLDRNTVEREFFMTQSSWRTGLDKSQIGGDQLKSRLSQVLQSSIMNALPTIEAQVNSCYMTCKSQLEALGPERSTSQKQKEHLVKCGHLYEKEVQDALAGRPKFGQLATTANSLRARVRVMGEAFRDQMHLRGSSWKLVREHSGSSDRRSLANDIGDVLTGKCHATVELCEADVLPWLTDRFKQHRGQQPPNLLDPQWAGELFLHQSCKWESIAQAYLDTVFSIVKHDIVKIVKEKSYIDIAGNVLQLLVLPEMKQLKIELDEKLRELCRPYSGAYPQTLSKRYADILQRKKWLKKFSASCWNNPVDDIIFDDCREILYTVDTYYEICSETFIDNVQNLGVEHCLLDRLEALAGRGKFDCMDSVMLDKLAGESLQIRRRRKELEDEKEQFSEAANRISLSLEAPRCADLNGHSFARLQMLDGSANGDVFTRPTGSGSTQRQTTSSYHLSVPLEKCSTSFRDSSADASVTPRHSVHGLSPTNPTKSAPQLADATDLSPALGDDIASNSANSSPPSTIFSNAGKKSPASNVSSYQNSPQPIPKKIGIVIRSPRRTSIGSSDL